MTTWADVTRTATKTDLLEHHRIVAANQRLLIDAINATTRFISEQPYRPPLVVGSRRFCRYVLGLPPEEPK